MISSFFHELEGHPKLPDWDDDDEEGLYTTWYSLKPTLSLSGRKMIHIREITRQFCAQTVIQVRILNVDTMSVIMRREWKIDSPVTHIISGFDTSETLFMVHLPEKELMIGFIRQPSDVPLSKLDPIDCSTDPWFAPDSLIYLHRSEDLIYRLELDIDFNKHSIKELKRAKIIPETETVANISRGSQPPWLVTIPHSFIETVGYDECYELQMRRMSDLSVTTMANGNHRFEKLLFSLENHSMVVLTSYDGSASQKWADLWILSEEDSMPSMKVSKKLPSRLLFDSIVLFHESVLVGFDRRYGSMGELIFIDLLKDDSELTVEVTGLPSRSDLLLRTSQSCITLMNTMNQSIRVFTDKPNASSVQIVFDHWLKGSLEIPSDLISFIIQWV